MQKLFPLSGMLTVGAWFWQLSFCASISVPLCGTLRQRIYPFPFWPVGSMIVGFQSCCFASFSAYFYHFIGITPPSPVTVPWSRPWRIMVPEFSGRGCFDHLGFSFPPSAPRTCFFSTFGDTKISTFMMNRFRHRRSQIRHNFYYEFMTKNDSS